MIRGDHDPQEDTAILSDSDEECLRPSLLRKRRHVHSQHSALHFENIPANRQTITPNQKAKGNHSTLYHTPAWKTPFTALFASCPSTGAAFSPTAEDNLFGSPAPSLPLGFSPVLDCSMYGSPAGQEQAKSSFGMSRALAHVSKLQKEHTQLVQQLKEHQHKQQQSDLQLKDAAFLQGRLQQLKDTSDATHSPDALQTSAAAGLDTRPAEEGTALDAQPAQTDTLELWQQLSFESSSNHEDHQVEELQAQLHNSTQQLRSKEAEVISLTVQLVSLHTQLEASQSQQADSAQQLEIAERRLAESTQQAEASLTSQERASEQAEALSAELEPSKAALNEVNNQLQAAQHKRSEQADLRSAAAAASASLTSQLTCAEQQIWELSSRLEDSKATRPQLCTQLEEAKQELEEVSCAHVVDESMMLDHLSEVQAEPRQVTEKWTESQAAQNKLGEQLAEARCERAEMEEAQILTEATLLDQLTDAQTELERSLTQVKHLEQRHQEMCQQLTIARAGQAEALEASREGKQQGLVQLRTALDELQHSKESLSTMQLEVEQGRMQLAKCSRELSESGMQRFELSQTLQDTQTQLAAQLELSGKLQTRVKKYRASHSCLYKELKEAKLESASSSEKQNELTELAESQQQALLDTQEQLKAANLELAQGHEAQAVLQRELNQAQDDRQQAQAQAEVLTSQLSKSAQQLNDSKDTMARLEGQLQETACRLEESQEQCGQACSDCLAMRPQLAETASQLEQSCSRQAEYALEQQRSANELEAARAESGRLACSLAQAEAIRTASEAHFKDLHSQHRKLRAKCEQLMVRNARHEALQADLAEAQAQSAAQCARLQMEEQKAEKMSRRLSAAGHSLSQALYSIDANSGQPVEALRGDVAESDLSSAAEQVCSLVQALLLYHNRPCPALVSTQGSKGGASCRQPVDVLRSHVAEAQARANHIVDEFESMLLVTGGHSMKEVMRIQSQAGLASRSPPAVRDRHQANVPLPARRRSSSATQTPSARPSSSHSSLNAGRTSQGAASSGSARPSVKCSATSSKENKAPTLTYVTGGQIRGSRKLHDVHVRQPLKPSITGNADGSRGSKVKRTVV